MRHRHVRVHDLPERVVDQPDTERERDRVRERVLLELRLAQAEHVRVDGGAERDRGLRAIADARLLAGERRDVTLNGRHLRLSAHEHDFVNLIPNRVPRSD